MPTARFGKPHETAAACIGVTTTPSSPWRTTAPAWLRLRASGRERRSSAWLTTPAAAHRKSAVGPVPRNRHPPHQKPVRLKVTLRCDGVTFGCAVCNQSLCDLRPPACKYGEKWVSYYRPDSCCPDYVCGEALLCSAATTAASSIHQRNIQGQGN